MLSTSAYLETCAYFQKALFSWVVYPITGRDNERRIVKGNILSRRMPPPELWRLLRLCSNFSIALQSLFVENLLLKTYSRKLEMAYL